MKTAFDVSIFGSGWPSSLSVLHPYDPAYRNNNADNATRVKSGGVCQCFSCPETKTLGRPMVSASSFSPRTAPVISASLLRHRSGHGRVMLPRSRFMYQRPALPNRKGARAIAGRNVTQLAAFVSADYGDLQMADMTVNMTPFGCMFPCEQWFVHNYRTTFWHKQNTGNAAAVVFDFGNDFTIPTW